MYCSWRFTIISNLYTPKIRTCASISSLVRTMLVPEATWVIIYWTMTFLWKCPKNGLTKKACYAMPNGICLRVWHHYCCFPSRCLCSDTLLSRVSHSIPLYAPGCEIRNWLVRYFDGFFGCNAQATLIHGDIHWSLMFSQAISNTDYH